MRASEPLGRNKFLKLEKEVQKAFAPRVGLKASVDLVSLAKALEMKYATVYGNWVKGRAMPTTFSNKILAILNQ